MALNISVCSETITRAAFRLALPIYMAPRCKVANMHHACRKRTGAAVQLTASGRHLRLLFSFKSSHELPRKTALD